MLFRAICNVYAEYENAVNALIALTNAEGYESSNRRCETLKFHRRALKELREKIENAEDSVEFMSWAQRSDEAFRLYVYGEHFARRVNVNVPVNDFEVLTNECFKKLEYLTTAKCLELYSK